MLMLIERISRTSQKKVPRFYKFNVVQIFLTRVALRLALAQRAWVQVQSFALHLFASPKVSKSTICKCYTCNCIPPINARVTLIYIWACNSEDKSARFRNVKSTGSNPSKPNKTLQPKINGRSNKSPFHL